jgi:hypothetical protein
MRQRGQNMLERRVVGQSRGCPMPPISRSHLLAGTSKVCKSLLGACIHIALASSNKVKDPSSAHDQILQNSAIVTEQTISQQANKCSNTSQDKATGALGETGGGRAVIVTTRNTNLRWKSKVNMTLGRSSYRYY